MSNPNPEVIIKKVFQPLIDILSASRHLAVADIYPQIENLCKAATGTGSRSSDSIIRDRDHNLVAVYCSYLQRYESVEEVEFGEKKGTASGLHNMCKEGASAHARQQSLAKKAQSDLIQGVTAGTIDPMTVATAGQAIEEARTAITPRTDYVGYATRDEAIAALLA